ncbi:MFS transporter [Cyanobacterium aponinum FACHB-4101]|uniref:MFS transporter n=1 Tax=Cyanobacterium aponinum TaxID=379064 RepID=UPI001681045D|nr:MFS transporter [Cyanobacterium aponinum FACHB-4101]
MRKFILIWFGQLVSTIGTYMTDFALTLWAWEITHSATALALMGFFSQLLRIPVNLLSGIIVDNINRKFLMILGDVFSAFFTIIIGFLFITNNLQIWHLYLIASLNGIFGEIQRLAYQTSVTLIVPKSEYTRVNSLNSSVHYGSAIFAPALAGILFPLINLSGILVIDFITFLIALFTLFIINIPQPAKNDYPKENITITNKLTFGFRYVWKNRYLWNTLILSAIFWFLHDLGASVDEAMILARSNDNSQVLGLILSSAGIGGVTGAIFLSWWGGTKNRLRGMSWGFMGAGIAKTVFGLGCTPSVWLPAQFCSSLNFPLLGSSETAFWMENVSPEIQGRVFASNNLILQVISAIASLLGGILADRIFEPWMMTDNIFSPLFGTQKGAGMSLLYVLCSVGMFFVGLWGWYSRKRMRN